MPARYVAIEGPMGVGKTSLSLLLAAQTGARAVLEPAGNPFVFASRQGGSAFQSQLFQLLSRYQQKDALSQEDLFARGGIVSDFLFNCDRIVAASQLGRDELALYDKVYGLLGRNQPRPDLVVYLQARPEVLLERVRKRAPGMVLGRDFVQKVAQAYAEYFFHYGEGPLLVVNTSEIDFVERRSDLDELVAVIQKTRAGISHYSPLGSR